MRRVKTATGYEFYSNFFEIVEPWFLAFNADVELTPVMVGEDLGKAGPSIGAAVEKYG